MDDRVVPVADDAYPSLLFMDGEAAARIRRRRRKPVGWLPVYVGLLTQVAWTGRGRAKRPKNIWEVAHFARHWGWLDRSEAFKAMSLRARKGASVIVVQVWVPARVAAGNPMVLELGPPRMELLKGFCWTLLTREGENEPIGPGSEGDLPSEEAAEVSPALLDAPLRSVPDTDCFWRRRTARKQLVVDGVRAGYADRYDAADLRGWTEFSVGRPIRRTVIAP